MPRFLKLFKGMYYKKEYIEEGNRAISENLRSKELNPILDGLQLQKYFMVIINKKNLTPPIFKFNGVFFFLFAKKCAFYLKKCNFVFVS